jgi:hypothetical protein
MGGRISAPALLQISNAHQLAADGAFRFSIQPL